MISRHNPAYAATERTTDMIFFIQIGGAARMLLLILLPRLTAMNDAAIPTPTGRIISRISPISRMNSPIKANVPNDFASESPARMKTFESRKQKTTTVMAAVDFDNIDRNLFEVCSPGIF